MQHNTRLNKFIASQLFVGRRQADTLIQEGKVTINGKVPVLGAQIDPAKDKICVNGKSLAFSSEANFVYLLLDKPIGYVCSRKQQGDAPTIFSLLPKKYQHLKPVGRLDKDSSGLLLLTNDGDTSHKFIHPSFGKQKYYQVQLNKPLAPLHRQMISDYGINLPDGPSKLILERQQDGNDKKWLVQMHEGRNRQIRRTFAALGYSVTKLRRTRLGNLSLDLLDGKKMTEISKPHL
ncbi:MAG: pseudouridine synthase [Candidatus Woesebacteria bacterium]|jgi:pseudouridine synthase